MSKADDGHTMPAIVSRFPAERAIPPATPSTLAGHIADAAACGAPRRRLLFGFGAALAAASLAAVPVPAAAEPVGADAELLALCAEFRKETAVIEAWNAGRVEEEDGEAANDRWWDSVDAMAEIPATTPTGLRAKAEIALLASEMAGGDGGRDEDLVRSALRDMAGMVAA